MLRTDLNDAKKLRMLPPLDIACPMISNIIAIVNKHKLFIVLF